ncbi:MAG TPA: pyrimidine dimer DNA glycosylase/endonuclease V [Burkholderiales bacterium]|nr:pyrimidine dimer DNA glycosylase/endonuclease V [Burkholderiales bacterium]
MRLWTLHPKYLDAKGLVALWREGLLAKHVLAGRTRGYRHHPQLERFRGHRKPEVAIDVYLSAVCAEAGRRGYRFNESKLDGCRLRRTMPETRGQLLYEWAHLLRKLRVRDPGRYRLLKPLAVPEPHPLFRVVAGGVRPWERTSKPRMNSDKRR